MKKAKNPAYVRNSRPLSHKSFNKYADFLKDQGFRFCGSGTGATVKYVTFDTPKRKDMYSRTFTKDKLQVTINNNNVAECHNAGLQTSYGRIHYKECSLPDLITNFDNIFTSSKDKILWDIVQRIKELHGDTVGKISIHQHDEYGHDYCKVYHKDGYCFQLERWPAEDEDDVDDIEDDFIYQFDEPWDDFKTAGEDKAKELLIKYTNPHTKK